MTNHAQHLSTQPGQTLVPLLVRAHLATGIAQASSWSIALDSLLAAELWARRKLDIRNAGGEPPSLFDTAYPEDIELPLARCSAGGDQWHWAATTAYPEGRPDDLPPDVHMWSGRVDHRALEQLTPDLPNVVSDRQGRYRARRMPLLVTVCSAVTWHCIGDLHAIKDLLGDITAIGKKRSHGEGQVIAWEFTELVDVDEWTAAHLHPDGTLGRPTPAACLTGHDVLDGGIGTAGLRPPYIHASRQLTLHLPISLDHHAS